MKNKCLGGLAKSPSSFLGALFVTALWAAPAALADPYSLLAEQLRSSRGTAETRPDADVWDRIRPHLTLQHLDNRRISAEFRWYESHTEYLERVSLRATPYLYHVVNEVDARGMPMELALLPIMESAYDPFAYSHGRAAGLWQIIPGTGRHLGLAQNWWYDGRRDVRASTDAALDYLAELNAQFQGDWLKTLGAYNAGPGRIRKAERENRRRGRPDDFWSLQLPAETRNYVPRLLALADVVADGDLSQWLTPVPNRPHFEAVDTGGQIDLSQAAGLAGIDIEVLYRLNPGFNQWATAPDGPHQLLVPASAVAAFVDNLTGVDPAERVQWTRYTIRGGDTLIGIARQFNTEPQLIRDINRLQGNRIVAGDTLMIPRASAPSSVYTLSADARQRQRRNTGSDASMDYRVQRGDSFWSIAQRFGVSSRRLAEWNGLAVRDPIHPGQTLVIRGVEAPPVAAGSSAVFPQREPMVRKLGYRVRSGDSLARIADKFNIRVEDILTWNDSLRGRKYIHPGQQLTLYVDITRSQGG